MTKPAGIFVVGPEATGTRLVTSIMIAAGAFGDAGHQQRLDSELPNALPGRPVVWRRSVPHGGKIPNLTGMLVGLIATGYRPLLVVTTREFHATVESQVRAGHVSNRAIAMAHIPVAYFEIFQAWAAVDMRTPVWLVSYEGLVQRPRATIMNLVHWAGLELTPTSLAIRINDGNAKYYEREVGEA